MWNLFKPGIILAIAASLVACGSGGSLSDKAKTSDDSLNNKVLPLPVIPETFVSAESRAGYLLRHFWDSLDFGRDTLLVRNRHFMEQNFVNYVSIFNISDHQTVLGTVKRLLYEAHKDSAAYMLLVDIAEKYLYDPESPMLNEEAYEAFLLAERAEEGEYNTPERKVRLDYQLASIAKNRRGEEATDFEYTRRDGTVTSLQKTDAPGYILLVFFDPTCEGCRKCVDLLENDVVMNSMLKRHRMTVLAIDINGSRDTWEHVKHNYPMSWHVGLDHSHLRSNDVYVMRNMPSMYLLDSDRNVILKDVSVENLFSYLCDDRNAFTKPL
jgi:peroxiredoxin